MINAGGVVVDAGLYETSPIIREGLLPLHPRTAHSGAILDTDEAGSDTNVVVLGVHRSEGYGPTDLVRRLRHAAPALGIFVVAKHGELSTGERQRLATVGVDRVLGLERLSKKRLGRLVERRVNASAPKRALNALSLVQFDPEVGPLVHWTVRNACYRLSIEVMAEHFWLSSRTIRRRLKRHGVPGYRALKALGIHLHALELEAFRGYTRGDAARRLGYRDGTHLSKVLGTDPACRREPNRLAALAELYI